jgi:hypothetical protein
MERRASELRNVTRHFNVLCLFLKENDPQLQEIVGAEVDDNICEEGYRCCYPSGYGRRLGESLRDNTHVTSCSLDLNGFCSAQDMDDVFAPWRHFFRRYETLRTVSLYYSGESMRSDVSAKHLFKLMATALSESQSIEDVEIRVGIAVPLDAFGEMMRSSKSLKELGIDLNSFDADCAAKHVFAAFDGNRTLERLTVGSTSNSDVVLGAFQALRAHPTLRELSVDMSRGDGMVQIKAFAAFLHSTRSLQRLSLDHDGCFDRKQMACIVAGLQVNTSITALWLDFCELDAGATFVFVKFMQSTKTIRELYFGRDVFQYSSLGKVMGVLLMDSSLRTLRFGPATEFDPGEFSARMEDCVVHIPLEGLHVFDWGQGDPEELFQWIPALPCLQELSIPPLHCEENCSVLLDFVRQSWSLTLVDVGHENHVHEAFDKLDLCRLQAYCQRNLFFKTLLSKCTTNSSRPPVDKFLLPSLFAVAKQAPRIRLNELLAALLISRLGLGSTKDGKRLDLGAQ